ncbi:MAG TPA: hypothetical protein VLT92_10390 [Burkholderiales bacterium]|nr:hypothetical protein [Burkholderiales bacterium]
MHYLDPRSPNLSKKLFVPAAGELKGKTLGFLNNGWLSMAKIGRHIEGPLKAKYGLARVLYYDVPRSMAPPAGFLEKVADECQMAIVGMAN